MGDISVTLQVCDGSDWKTVGTASGSKLGSSKDNPASGCKHLLDDGVKVSGVYWMLPSGASQPFQVCLKFAVLIKLATI